MARAKRELKDGLSLLRQRGDFFINASERQYYEELFLKTAREKELKIYAYFLSDKEIIFLIEGKNISSFMQLLNSTFIRYRNKLREGKGLERFEARLLGLDELNINLNLLNSLGATILWPFSLEDTAALKMRFKENKGSKMDLEALSPSQHKDLLYHKEALPDLAFVNIVASEAMECERDLSIVFTKDAVPQLVVLLGQNSNVMMDDQYRGYIPASLQNYPFCVIKTGEEDTLCIDKSAANFEGEGERLFNEEGEKSPFLEEIIQVMGNYNSQIAPTTTMIKEIAQNNLLMNKELNVNIDGQKSTLIKGFCVVDRKRLNALSDEVLADFARRGYLEFIYAHLRSLRHFNTLAGRILSNE